MPYTPLISEAPFNVGMRLPPLVISDEDRVEMERRVRPNTVEARAAQRARIILLAADGASNPAIGDRAGTHHNGVGLWRQRFQADGLAGLLAVGPDDGREREGEVPSRYSPASTTAGTTSDHENRATKRPMPLVADRVGT